MKVTVIGAGYVGLVAAACLSRSGHEVICIDKDEQKLAKLRAGRLPFFEEGLEEILHDGLAKRTLSFGKIASRCLNSEIVLIAVGTPAQADGRIDLSQIHNVNNRQRVLALRKLRNALGKLHDKTVCVLGLSFKPGTDDVRESPANQIIALLLDEGAKIKAYDPLAMANARKLLPDRVSFASSALEATAHCHVLLLATAWPEFINMNWSKVKALMRPPYVLLDGRVCLPADVMIKKGFHYLSIGRPQFHPEPRKSGLKKSAFKKLIGIKKEFMKKGGQIVWSPDCSKLPQPSV